MLLKSYTTGYGVKCRYRNRYQEFAVESEYEEMVEEEELEELERELLVETN